MGGRDERLPAPGAGMGWNGMEEGQYQSHQGFCPICDAARGNGDTPRILQGGGGVEAMFSQLYAQMVTTLMNAIP
ncbi:hypothetical protein WISP_139260 [Willisornis vidua]|uniref:Uncharacterized protein n=1 Tax=Willisornis vidua TaxID=1566151 RepID=A0ABQ9CNE9_9PASS|nr:hypothetical protein WISP_139260 [Willisornis vidua]